MSLLFEPRIVKRPNREMCADLLLRLASMKSRQRSWPGRHRFFPSARGFHAGPCLSPEDSVQPKTTNIQVKALTNGLSTGYWGWQACGGVDRASSSAALGSSPAPSLQKKLQMFTWNVNRFWILGKSFLCYIFYFSPKRCTLKPGINCEARKESRGRGNFRLRWFHRLMHLIWKKIQSSP